MLEAQQKQLAELERTIGKLEAAKPALTETVNALAGAVQAIGAYGPVEAQYEAEMEAVRNDTALSEEERQQKLAALSVAPEYVQAKAALAQVDFALSAQGLTRADAAAAYSEAQAALGEVDAGLAKIDETLAGMELTRADIPTAAAQLKDGLAQVEEGISALQGAMGELNSGKIQVEEAFETLQTEKEKAGKQLNSAASKIKSGEKELASALEQVEDGIAQLEDARAEAIKQADLQNIVTMDMVAQHPSGTKLFHACGLCGGGRHKLACERRRRDHHPEGIGRPAAVRHRHGRGWSPFTFGTLRMCS